MGFWWGIWLRLLVVFITATGLIYLYGPAVAFAVTSTLLLLMLMAHWWQLGRLMHWVESGQTEKVPESVGLWGDMFATLYHQQKNHQRDRAELSASLDRLHLAASALPDGVIILDKEGRIEWFNSVAIQQFSLDPSRDVGTPATHLIRQPEFATHLARDIQREPVLLKGGQGLQRLSVSLIPFADDGRLLLSRDVTQIERVDTIRRDFVANVSHELRTPLTVATGFLEHLVDDDNMPLESRKQFLGMVEDQVGRMNRLVDDLLALSRLEATPQLVSEEVVDVPALAAHLADEARILSNGRHQIEIDVADSCLRGSPSELRSAFGNLIGNAVRYTPEGGKIKVIWRLENGTPVFAVTDSGIGIAPEHISRLTERFYRVDKGRSAATGGTGLGLAIVKHVLQRHQATLDIRSTLGEGSTFRAVFPLVRLVPADGQKAAAA
jgi:two-component system phosphate regulon sensor histidine kinase PhoR